MITIRAGKLRPGAGQSLYRVEERDQGAAVVPSEQRGQRLALPSVNG